MEEGFQPQLLFTDLVLEEEDRAALLRAVVKAEPAFRPPPQAPSPVNTSTLLKDIYSKVSPRQEVMTACFIPSLHQAHVGPLRGAPPNPLPLDSPVLGVCYHRALVPVAFCIWLIDYSVLKVPSRCGICWKLAPTHGSVVFQCVDGASCVSIICSGHWAVFTGSQVSELLVLWVFTLSGHAFGRGLLDRV